MNEEDSLILRLSAKGFYSRWRGRLEPDIAKTLSEALEKIGMELHSAEELDPNRMSYKQGEYVIFSRSNKIYEELKFCMDLWEKQGYCQFGGHTKCEQCGTPYLLLKLINGEVIHGDMKRLTLEDWKNKLKTIDDAI